MASTQNKGKLSYGLYAINIIPLLLLGLASILLASHWFTKAMYSEVETELDNVTHNMVTLFETAWPGDYHLEGDAALRLYKGDCDITGDYSLIDRVKTDTGLEITLFYQDTRILTTITNAEGKRIVGSGAPDIVVHDVLKAGESHFYTNTLINNTKYFAYYLPLRNSDGSVVGMMFVGKPCSEVDQAILHSVYPLIIADILVMLVAAVAVFLYTRNFAGMLSKIRLFLSDVADGNLNTELDASVLRRNDELGDIGRSALTMQRALRTMVERDALTELYNRRCGDRRLRQIMDRSAHNHTPFCIAIGDIDFFKKVNDTYGHECGDAVLREVAGKLHEHMLPYGFAVRWGGEEFLLAYERMDLNQVLPLLEKLLEDIRSMECRYDSQVIRVTMTFGVAEGGADDLRTLFRRADEKLYEGKSAGRNRIVT